MKKIVLTVFLIAVLGLIATTAIGSKGGKNCGGNCSKKAVAATDPAMAEIQNKYADDYSTIEKKLVVKREKMDAAWGKDTTTVGEINILRNEMLDLKKEYLILNDKVQREYAEANGEIMAKASGDGAKVKGHSGKQGMKKKGCAKKGKDSGMKAGKENCQGKEKCKGGADCPKQ